MNIAFRFNLANPVASITQYASVLSRVDYSHLQRRFPTYQDALIKPLLARNIKFFKLKDELRTLQYCSFIHPLTYQKFGKVPNWYDKESISEHVKFGNPLYDKAGKDCLPEYLKNQQTFIKKIQKLFRKKEVFIEEKSLIRYEQFMTLVKMYKGEFLSPPFDVDVVWHGHMLDHRAYVKSTSEYLGFVLDHNDDEKPNYLFERQKRTEELWNKHFGSDSKSSNSSCAAGCTFYYSHNSPSTYFYPGFYDSAYYTHASKPYPLDNDSVGASCVTPPPSDSGNGGSSCGSTGSSCSSGSSCSGGSGCSGGGCGGGGCGGG